MALLTHFQRVLAHEADDPELYVRSDEKEEFQDALDDLEHLFIQVEAQVAYYETVALGWPNFVDQWKDYYGQDGSGADHWYGGDVQEIRVDGSYCNGPEHDCSMDAWYDGRREIDIVRDGKHHYGKYIDGRIYVTNDDSELGRRTWILERYPNRDQGTPGHTIDDTDNVEPIPVTPVPSRFTFVNERKTWEEAQAHCAFIGQNLATITNPQEND